MEADKSPGPAGEDPMHIFSDSFGDAAPPTEPPTQLPPLAVRVLNKCAYGPRPTDVAAFNALGGNDDARLNAWLTAQLNPDSISDSACTNRINAGGYTTYTMTLPQMWATHVRGSQSVGGPAAWPRRHYPCEEAACIKLIRATYSERQLLEVMVDFWHNHFNVQGWEFSISPVFMHYDRDVMRGKNSGNRFHALGNFRVLLEEVAKAPAMLMYLDNKSSRGTGFNENFARELCELHTLGAENYYGTATAGTIPRYGPETPWPGLPMGYSDFYVYEAARCLTGWTMRDAHWEFPNSPEYDTGEFLYHSPWHDRASKNFLASDWGDLIEPDGPAMADGRYVFDKLASHPGTAQHICRKLCCRFIGDDPPQSLIDSAAAIWRAQWQSHTQIAQVLQHILTSTAFKSTWGEKTKRPWEALMQSLRATSADIAPKVTRFTIGANNQVQTTWDDYADLNGRISQSGNGPFRWPTPDGYPDHGHKWQAVSPLSQTWRTLSRLVEMRTPGSGDTPFLLHVEQTTLNALPAASRSAQAIVDFWIGRIFGYAIDPTRRARLIDFMRQTAAPTAALDLVEDDMEGGVRQRRGVWNGGSNGNNRHRHYTIARLRAMVALMMMCPEFYHR